MKKNYIYLSNRVKKLLENRFTKEQLASDYIYNQLDKLLAEVEANKFTSNKTEIGQAAIKLFDTGSSEDSLLSAAICDLADMYRRIQTN